MLIEAFLPYWFHASALPARRLFQVIIIFWVAMFAEVSFDRRDYRRVVSRVPGCDDHMEMVGQNDDGINMILKLLFAVCKCPTQELNVVDENRIAPVCYDGEIIAVSIEEYPSVVCHIYYSPGK